MGTHERKEREKELRRDEIVRAATKVFFEKGLQNATMDEIADLAELSKGTIYLYYKSKEDLYLAVMNVGSTILFEMFDRAVAKAPSTIERLLILADTYKAFFSQHRNYFRMFHFLQNQQLHKQVSPEMREISRLHQQRVWDLAVGILRRGVEEGLLRRDIDPAEMAVVLWSATNSLLMQIDYQHEHWKHSLGIDIERVLSHSTNLLLEAIMTDAGRAEYRRHLAAIVA